MRAELGIDRTLHDINRCAKYHVVEFFHHLPWFERTEIATLLGRRTRRVLGRELGKLGAQRRASRDVAVDLILQRLRARGVFD